MTIPKRFEEVLEEHRESTPVYVASVRPLEYKTGGVVAGLLAEAFLDGVRIGYLTAERREDNTYVLDGVYVDPQHRNQGIGMNLVRKAHQTAPFTPYVLTENQVYQSEAGRRIAEKEYHMMTASTIHIAGPLALLAPEALALGGEALGAGAAAEGAGAAAGAAAGEAGAAGSTASELAGAAKGLGRAHMVNNLVKGLGGDNSGSSGSDTGNASTQTFQPQSVNGVGAPVVSDGNISTEGAQPTENLNHASKNTTWEVREAGLGTELLHGIAQAPGDVVNAVGRGISWVGQGMSHALHDQGSSGDSSDPGFHYIPSTIQEVAGGIADMGAAAGLGYGVHKARQFTRKHKGLGNMINKIRNSPMADSVRDKFGRGASVQIELDLEQDIHKIMQMLKCLCGRKCEGMFNGMPHCLPGEGCCSNYDSNSHACGSCGNPAATESFRGMALCSPGQPGCNEEYRPGSESIPQMAAEHEDWAVKTNHGQYRMPGEPIKPEAPMQMAASRVVTSWAVTADDSNPVTQGLDAMDQEPDSVTSPSSTGAGAAAKAVAKPAAEVGAAGYAVSKAVPAVKAVGNLIGDL